MKIIYSIFLYFTVISLFSETLWNDKSGNIYSSKINFKINESIKIKIFESSILNYTSSSKSLKTVSIDVKSNDIVGVFELIPEGSIDESKSGQEKDKVNYTGDLQGQITGVGDNFITISGVKSISINNKTSKVELTGDVAFLDVKGNVVLSSDIMNLVLKITTVIDSTVMPVSADDFISQTEIDTTTDINGETVETVTPTGKFILSDDKKREFLLNYLNKILNVVF